MTVFFIIWGWRHRVIDHGVVGPYTCPTCSWVGTFWLRQMQRQLRVYFVPVTKWTEGSFVTTCRNCGTGVAVDKAAVAGVLSAAQPISAPDPFGPAQADGPAPFVPASPMSVPRAAWPAQGGPGTWTTPTWPEPAPGEPGPER